MKGNITELKNLATNIRITALKGLRELGFGHIGGSPKSGWNKSAKPL